jgi:hypothetical protein
MNRYLVISVIRDDGEEQALFATPQLIMALTRLRLVSVSRYLWIDQLCIDQDNEDEKAPQIQLMGQIYRKAQRVIVWLGEAPSRRVYEISPLTDLLDVDVLANLIKEFTDRPDATPNDDLEIARKLVTGFPAINWMRTIEQVRLMAIYEVLKRPWFRRAWIVQVCALRVCLVVICQLFRAIADSNFAQEASLGRELFIQYGPLEVRFEDFKRVIDSVFLSGSRIGFERKGLAKDTCGFEMLQFIQEARQGFLETHPKGDGISGSNGLLQTLLRVLRRVDAFNPRDLIFAFLAFQNDEGIISTKESYQQASEKVWKHTAEQIIKASGSLDIFAALSGDTVRPLKLPSWVPYWSDCFPYSRPIATPVSRFHASRGLPHIWNQHDDPRKLRVRGKIVDSIKAFASIPFGYQGFQPSMKLFLKWIVLPDQSMRYLYGYKNTLGDQLQVKLQTLDSDLMRTVLCDGAMGSEQPLRRISQIMRVIATEQPVRELRNSGTSTEMTEEQKDMLENYEKLEDLALVAERKRMFWTENLQLGMACDVVQVGDQIGIIHGSKVPCLLRPVGSDSREYRVISQCYLDGWMYGKTPKERPHPHGKWWEEEQDEIILL